MPKANGNLFAEKVALVTGASSGIGRATALAFAQNGAKLVLADVLEEGANQTLRMIEEMGRPCISVRCDVSKESDVKETLRRTLETFGRIDCAFNNAGIEGKQAFTAEATEENWDRVIDINLKGVWLCMKYEIPQMLKQGSGTIVNCSSIAGVVGFPGLSAYVASKHGVIGLTQSAALEYAQSKLRVNAVCPGVIQTPMVDRLVHGEAQVRDELISKEPIARVGKPEEIAAAVLWLCSEQSSFVTGHPLVVDGGWVAQ